MENHNERIGQLIQRYAVNKAAIACLRAQVKDAATTLTAFTSQLSNSPRGIKPNGEGKIVFDYGPKGKIDVDILCRLRATLAQLAEALDEREHMESCLKEHGLETFIATGPGR